jgi:hypothetical protein
MVHKVKATTDVGRRSSQRAIAEQPKISRDTVNRSVEMPPGDCCTPSAQRPRQAPRNLYRAAAPLLGSGAILGTVR